MLVHMIVRVRAWCLRLRVVRACMHAVCTCFSVLACVCMFTLAAQFGASQVDSRISISNTTCPTQTYRPVFKVAIETLLPNVAALHLHRAYMRQKQERVESFYVLTEVRIDVYIYMFIYTPTRIHTHAHIDTSFVYMYVHTRVFCVCGFEFVGVGLCEWMYVLRDVAQGCLCPATPHMYGNMYAFMYEW